MGRCDASNGVAIYLVEDRPTSCAWRCASPRPLLRDDPVDGRHLEGSSLRARIPADSGTARHHMPREPPGCRGRNWPTSTTWTWWWAANSSKAQPAPRTQQPSGWARRPDRRRWGHATLVRRCALTSGLQALRRKYWCAKRDRLPRVRASEEQNWRAEADTFSCPRATRVKGFCEPCCAMKEPLLPEGSFIRLSTVGGEVLLLPVLPAFAELIEKSGCRGVRRIYGLIGVAVRV